MNKIIIAMLIFATLLNSQTKNKYVHDYSTPEGAILCLEDAFRAKDIEKVVASRDFYIESKYSLAENYKDTMYNEETIKKLAEVLELAFRKEIEQNGFSDMSFLKNSFPYKKEISDGLVEVTEVCFWPDSTKSTQRVLVARTKQGWRFVTAID